MRKRHRRASLLRLLATRDVSAREDQDTEDFQSAKAWRVMVGVGICIGSSLPPWHSLPVFIDEKIAADPFLPGLTEATLPITTTAIFVGWVVGSLGLPRAMQVFSTEQLLLVCVVGLVLISFALVTVPYITAGSLAAFTCLRFVQGIFMNITMLQCIYVQDSLPSEWGNRALVCTNVMYCLFDIFMSAICGGPALNADWRIESLLFYAVPMPLGILIAFPNFMEILKSIPQAGKALFQSSSRFQPVSTSAVESSLSPSEIHHAIALASAFLACGCSFHGLSYSAGQLSSNRYMSMALLNGADIVGYLGALSAGSWGRGKVQSTAFFLASLSSLDWAIEILWVCDFNFQLNHDHVVRCASCDSAIFHYMEATRRCHQTQSAFACLTFFGVHRESCLREKAFFFAALATPELLWCWFQQWWADCSLMLASRWSTWRWWKFSPRQLEKLCCQSVTWLQKWLLKGRWICDVSWWIMVVWSSLWLRKVIHGTRQNTS